MTGQGGSDEVFIKGEFSDSSAFKQPDPEQSVLDHLHQLLQASHEFVLLWILRSSPRSQAAARPSERATIMAVSSFSSPPTLTAFGDALDKMITTGRNAAGTILVSGVTVPIQGGRATVANACDHCGGRFGMVTHRWWGSKFCKRTCKDAYLREPSRGRNQIVRWYGFLRLGTAIS